MKWTLNIEILLIYIVTCQGDGIQVTKNNIRQLLSDSEWELLVGSSPETDYEIIHPSLHRSRRSTTQKTISISGLGKSWLSTISLSDSILSADFTLVRRNKNGTEDVTEQHKDELGCFYRGDNVAVSICDGISGIILNEGSNYYAINPLPKRLFNETIGEMPHVISRRLLPVHVNLDNRRLNTIYKNTNADLETISVINSTKLPNISNSTAKTFSDDFAKDHIFILDEGTKNKTTKPIFRSKSRRLFPMYTDSNDRIDRNKIDALGITDFKLEAINNTSSKKFRSFSRDFLNKFPKELEDLRSEKILKRNRIKRGTSNSSPIFVETAVFVDRDLYKHMTRHYPKNTERELIRFVLAMINAVQLLYHDPSLGQVVNFVLKRLEILHTDPTGLHRPHDIDKYLSSFCQWQGRENPGNDQDTRHWDHALMLTGLDLYVVNKRGKVSSQVVGLAPVAGMCTKTSSCTVNEGRHFESVYVVAHEIGHNLGMRHDGGASNNDCDSTSFIMSPTLGSGKITWSPCSKNYLQHFLQTAQSRCLLDHGSSGGQLDHSAEGILPGERFDSDQQCMLKYGFGSRHSSQQPLEDICRDMHCERERYTWTSHPALEGTYCGEDKWCRGGRCTDRSGNFRTSGNNEKVSGAWSAWHLSECASGCLYEEESQMNPGSTGIRVIVRSCNNPSPKNGGERCNGPRKRYIACKATQCTKIPRTTISEFADEICTRARKVDKDLLGTGLQRISSDPEEACTVWCRTKNEGAKSRGWTFPDGTKCRMRRNDFYKSTYCIVGRCEEFRCSVPEEYKFIDSSERCYGLSTNRIDRKDDIELLSKTLNPEKAKDDWAVTSNCHFNCIAPGIGIRLVSRIKRRTNETSIQLCDPDSNNCEKLKSPYQFATNICSKYKRRVRRLSGLGIQISPSIEDPDRPCRVACQDETVSHRFYMVNGENGWFPFGTACSKGNRKSFCVTGKCLEFGEDDTPLHESIFALPLLSRYKRSENITKNSRHGSKTERNNVDRSNSLSRKKRDLEFDRTTVLSHLNQRELDSIIWQLNFSGSYRSSLIPFQIDLNNPIHVPLDEFDYRIYDYP